MIKLLGRSKSFKVRANWFHFWAKVFLWIINGNVVVKGKVPTHGIVACNHLSYADIIVLGSIFPLVIVSKSEVASWPVIGPLTQCAGTLFIRRASKADVVRIGNEMATVINSGVPLALFLEGTTSTGETVLPFHSSLLAPVEKNGFPVFPAWMHYTVVDGTMEKDICYVGDDTFFPHSLKMMTKPSFEAYVGFGEPVTGMTDRKETARELHARVCRIKDDYFAAKKEPAQFAAK
ncbi:MAG TPA: lysophospholipid acyltransferase family protein [Verrucomicrobiae bacterium]|nr:lysophospholipid acyltransferase family protein [Verrucomicrobiae bacterium]